MLKYVCRHHIEEYDWFVRAVDDAYIKVDQLLGLLSTLDKGKMVSYPAAKINVTFLHGNGVGQYHYPSLSFQYTSDTILNLGPYSGGFREYRGVNPHPQRFLFACQFEHSYGPAFSRTLTPFFE